MTILAQAKYAAPIRSTPGRAAIVLFVAGVLTSGVYFASKSGADIHVYRNDFNVYYFAAHEVISGRDPYQRSIGEWTPYLYPPLLAELLVPLAQLPLPLAAWVWFVINAVSIGAAAWMSAVLATQGAARSDVWRALLAACALLVILRFVLDNFNLGQVNLVVAGLAVAHVYLYARNRKLLSAIAFVLAVSIKLTPGLLLVYHVAKLRLRFAAMCIALLAAVTLASFLPFGASGVEAFRTFAHRTLNNEQGFDFAYSGNQSLHGAVLRLTNAPVDDLQGRSPADAVTLAICIVILLLAIFAGTRAHSELAAAAPLFCCLVLLSPLSWKAHFVVFVVPAAYLLSRARASTGGRRLLIGSLLVAVFSLFNLTSPHVIGLAAAEWSDAHSLVFTGALLLFLFSLCSGLRKPTPVISSVNLGESSTS